MRYFWRRRGSGFGGHQSSGAAFNPLAIFADGTVGVAPDFGDLAAVFQDSAGTTAGAVASPIGLALDKSRGLALGSELVTNGSFTTDTSGWTATGLSAAVVSGEAELTRTGSSQSFTQAVTTSAGSAYQLTFRYRNGTQYGRVSVGTSAGGVQLLALTDVSSATQATFSGVFFATGATSYIGFALPATGTFYIDDVSVRELKGAHLSQSSGTLKPILRSVYADFDGADDFLSGNVAGGSTTAFLIGVSFRLGATGSVQTLWSDRGTNTGFRLAVNASDQLEFSGGNGSAFTAINTSALSSGTDYAAVAWYDGANLNLQLRGASLVTGALASVSAGSTTFTIAKSNTSSASYLTGRVYRMLGAKNNAGTASYRSGLLSYLAQGYGG